jgi:hypothetical protein
MWKNKMEEKLYLRTVSLFEINACPCKRLDPAHYVPIHRTWECNHKDKQRTKGAIVNAWLENKINSEQFLLAYQQVTHQQKCSKKTRQRQRRREVV